MNTIKLCGGLGNQLFQYAFGKAQILHGIDVQFDASWYQKFSARNSNRLYILDKFETKIKLGSKQPGRPIIEKGFDINLLQKDGFNFNGYWQYPAYSEKVLSELKNEIVVRKELYTREFLSYREEIMMDSKSIAVHVRRGDYLYLEGFPVQPLEYYTKAIERLNGNVYVFSDDIEWCKENFKGVKFIYLNEYFDFELMRLCKHQIASRSSFSWWAAHLNNNPNKIVIIPKQQIDCPVRKRAVNKELEIFDPKDWIQC
jgi:hypothetical protein